MSENLVQRHYLPQDLRSSSGKKELSKKELIALIKGEPSHIPRRFNESKINKKQLLDLLLADDSPFRTTKPIPSSISLTPGPGEVSNSSSGSSDPPKEINNSTSCSSEPQRRNIQEDVCEDEAGESEESTVDIRLYIYDCRYINGFQNKTSTTITVEATVNALEDGEGRGIRLSMQNLIQKLQSGSGVITGNAPVKIGVQDSVKPDFTEFFIHGEPSSLHTAETSPAFLFVAVHNTANTIELELRVDYVNRETKMMAPNAPSSLETSLSRCHETHAVTSTGADSNDGTNELVRWLRERAQARDGYKEFTNLKHRRFPQNHQLAQAWKFAAEFSEAYHKRVDQVSQQPKKILKSDIHKALGIGETWLAQAEEANRILKIFGEGGTDPSDTVKAKVLCEGTESAEVGSGKFLAFLKKWNREHQPAL